MAEPLALGVITNLRNDPAAALRAVRELDIPTVQVSYSSALDNEDGVRQTLDAVQQSGVEITAVFCGFAGESYADIPTVRATVGLVPAATRAVRLAQVATIAGFAQKLGVSRVAAHIGCIPEDPTDSDYAALVAALREVCDDAAQRGQVFALETGQETAAALQRFINDVDRPNLRVNFDPANMILYGNDNPIEALPILAPWIDGVHCKDGQWPTQKDQLGHETPLGEGDVNIALWLENLLETGYRGPLTIEREISGAEQKRDILKATALLRSLIAGSTG